MQKIRIGIIGTGVMGEAHAKTLQTIKNCELTAVCDHSQKRLSQLADILPEESKIKKFFNHQELIDSNLCDAVVISTPHPSHLEIAEYAFKAGLHVMCEKPITIKASEADRMLSVWQGSTLKFSTMFSMRTASHNRTIKDYLEKGLLGKILRAKMICTKWFRTQHYYDSQNWRGTWNGEGGGLLMNQAPHNLDLLFWWFGEAFLVEGNVFRRFHKIETEDEVFATIWTRAGFPISFYSNTAEAPGRDFVEIVGDKGTILCEDGKVIFRKLKTPLQKLIGKNRNTMPLAEYEEIAVEVPERPRGHKVVFENFLDVIAGKLPEEALISPGCEGIHAVEWANAILMSSMNGKKTKLPVDRAEYDKLLEKLKNEETFINNMPV
jgi:predicted dehydrogenase